MLEVVRDVFGSEIPSCETPSSDSDGDGYTTSQGDCNDSDDSINPSASKICGDGIDQDCDGIDAVCQSSIDGGYDVTSELWAKAVLQVAGSPVTLAWKIVGADITPSGDQVVSGYFYADPYYLCKNFQNDWQ